MLWFKPHDLNSTVDTHWVVLNELGSGLGGDIAPRTAVELHTECLCLFDGWWDRSCSFFLCQVSRLWWMWDVILYIVFIRLFQDCGIIRGHVRAGFYKGNYNLLSCVMLHSEPGHITFFFPEKLSLASVISVFQPVKFFLSSGIIQSILVCIASNVLTIRIKNKNCSYLYNFPFFPLSIRWQKYLVWMQLCWFKNK